MPERACQVLGEELEASSCNLKSFRRETPEAISDQTREPLDLAA